MQMTDLILAPYRQRTSVKRPSSGEARSRRSLAEKRLTRALGPLLPDAPLVVAAERFAQHHHRERDLAAFARLRSSGALEQLPGAQELTLGVVESLADQVRAPDANLRTDARGTVPGSNPSSACAARGGACR